MWTKITDEDVQVSTDFEETCASTTAVPKEQTHEVTTLTATEPEPGPEQSTRGKGRTDKKNKRDDETIESRIRGRKPLMRKSGNG